VLIYGEHFNVNNTYKLGRKHLSVSRCSTFVWKVLNCLGIAFVWVWTLIYVI